MFTAFFFFVCRRYPLLYRRWKIIVVLNGLVWTRIGWVGRWVVDLDVHMGVHFVLSYVCLFFVIYRELLFFLRIVM